MIKNYSRHIACALLCATTASTIIGAEKKLGLANTVQEKTALSMQLWEQERSSDLQAQQEAFVAAEKILYKTQGKKYLEECIKYASYVGGLRHHELARSFGSLDTEMHQEYQDELSKYGLTNWLVRCAHQRATK